jgi:hypothetical protein
MSSKSQSRVARPMDRSEIERQELAAAIRRVLPRNGCVEMQLGLTYSGLQLQPNRSMESPNQAFAKAVTAVSPLQFQKPLRLQETRRLMLTESLDGQRGLSGWLWRRVSFQSGVQATLRRSATYKACVN